MSVSTLPTAHDRFEGEEVWQVIIDHGRLRKSGRISLRSYDPRSLEKVQIASNTIIMHLHIIGRSP
jgi:hypothetical protein